MALFHSERKAPGPSLLCEYSFSDTHFSPVAQFRHFLIPELNVALRKEGETLSICRFSAPKLNVALRKEGGTLSIHRSKASKLNVALRKEGRTLSDRRF
jgi:hypothetical protein